MFLSNARISVRLGIGFGLSMALTISLVALGLFQMSEMKTHMDAIVRNDMARISNVDAMHTAVLKTAIVVRNIALLSDDAAIAEEAQRLASLRAKYTAAEQQLHAVAHSPEALAILARIDAAKTQTNPLIEKVLALAKANKDSEAIQILLQTVRPAQLNWLAALEDLAKFQERHAAAFVAEAQAAYTKAWITMLSLTALAMALGALAAFLITRGITRPLTEAVRMAQLVATGDLTGQITVAAHDETGQLMQSLKHMNDSLTTVIRQVSAHAESVASAATQLAAASSQIAVGSQHQSEATSAMSAAVEEMTVSIDQVAENAKQAQIISTEAGDLSSQGAQEIHEVMDGVRKIGDSVGDSARVIRELEQKSNQISQVTKVIKEIADQTNLLALNAAIEAARAGEQGRGFAVVADEVRQLAERTTRATQEIATMVESIQSGTCSAVATMETAVTRAHDGARLADQAGVSVSSIKDGAVRVVGVVNDISLALKEQSAASNDIAKNVEKIAQMVEENSAAMQETASTAAQLERQSESLNEVVSRFKLQPN